MFKERFAKIVNDGSYIRINDDEKEDLLTKHYKPNNLENLQVPTSGPHWDEDNKPMISQNSQTLVRKVLYPLLDILDYLMKTTSNKIEMKTTDVKIT